MAIGSRSYMSSRASLRRRVATPTISNVSRTHQLPGNQQLLRSQRTGALAIQPKLRLSQENDPAERQADAVAEQIVAKEYASGPVDAVPSQINRACAKCEEDLLRQADPEVEEPEAAESDVVSEEEEADETGMPKRDPNSSSVSETVIPPGSGRALSGEVLSRMEDGFGTNFDQVRVHSDSASAKATSQVGALAFTVGSDVYFGDGQYAPNTQSGTKLLAHELTHVAQQQARAGTLARKEISGNKQVGTGQQRRPRPPQGSVCSAGNCPQGRRPRAVRDDCGDSGPVSETRFITHLEVSVSGHTVVATWSDGHHDTWPCSANSGITPTGGDTVGHKCTINHTNRRRDGMAWFTAFASTGHRIGFHDSQPVGSNFSSHGCVRVCCDVARTINRNTSSGTTTINVS